MNKFIICTLLLALIMGCNSGEGPDAKSISIEEFEQQILAKVGEQAVNCGKVEIGESPFTVNSCVSDSFIVNTPFYAVYVRQGIDSILASGLSMDASGEVEYWSYDSDISGGSNSESRVTTTLCENPIVASDLNDINIDAIECSS